MPLLDPLPIRSYRDLIAWRKSMGLILEVYRCTRGFPPIEAYGLVSQMRRAAVSVASNIAEGHARTSSGEFRQFLGHALGSLAELETQAIIAVDLEYLDRSKSDCLLEHASEVGKLINGLLRSLKPQAH
jgi:four helix bundle protein